MGLRVVGCRGTCAVECGALFQHCFPERLHVYCLSSVFRPFCLEGVLSQARKQIAVKEAEDVPNFCVPSAEQGSFCCRHPWPFEQRSSGTSILCLAAVPLTPSTEPAFFIAPPIQAEEALPLALV